MNTWVRLYLEDESYGDEDAEIEVQAYYER